MCFAALNPGVPEKKFMFSNVDLQNFMTARDFFLKKYFGSLENGCIFASAFDGKRLVEKVVENEARVI